MEGQRPPEVFIACELDRLARGFAGGHFPALVEALLLCTANAVPLPAWVGEHAAEALTAAFNGQPLPGTSRGRTGGLDAQAEAHHRDYLRWSVAETWMANRAQLPAFGYPATIDGAYELAADDLRRAASFAVGSPAAIKQSHERVRQAFKAGEGHAFLAAGGDPPDAKSPQKIDRIKPARAKSR